MRFVYVYGERGQDLAGSAVGWRSAAGDKVAEEAAGERTNGDRSRGLGTIMVNQAGKYAKLKSEEADEQPSSSSEVGRDVESQQKPLGEKTIGEAAQEFTRKTMVVIALTILTSSQGLLIAVSKQGGKFEYSVMSANCMVETTKCVISLLFLMRQWNTIGVTEDNTLVTTLNEIWVFPIPALLYLIKNLMQYVIFLYVDPPSYQVLKNLNIITTGILYRIFLKKKLNSIQWSALILLTLGCTTSQLNTQSDNVLSTPTMGVFLAIVMALLSGAAGVYTEMIIKKRPQRSINVQNFYLYSFGIVFNMMAIFMYDNSQVMEKGFFYGYSSITFIMIMNHALSGLAVSMVMKYANNITKVYSTSVAMLLTTLISIPLFGFELSLPFMLGSGVVTVAVFLHSQAKKK